MKWQALFGVAFVVFVVAGDPAQEAVKKDLAKLEGTWILVSYESAGVKADEERLKDFGKVTIKGEKYTWSSGDSGSLKIDPSKKPKRVDYGILDGEGKVQSYEGIYEIDGDTFRDCYAPPGAERPTEFKAAQGSGHVLMTYKREKAEQK